MYEQKSFQDDDYGDESFPDEEGQVVMDVAEVVCV